MSSKCADIVASLIFTRASKEYKRRVEDNKCKAIVPEYGLRCIAVSCWRKTVEDEDDEDNEDNEDNDDVEEEEEEEDDDDDDDEGF